MSTLQEIERAVAGLAAPELKELYWWMDERLSDAVDAKMKADLESVCLTASSTKAWPMRRPGPHGLSSQDVSSSRAYGFLWFWIGEHDAYDDLIS